jgi:tripartite-type tricarboxylate transporter receptor subunit TctC
MRDSLHFLAVTGEEREKALPDVPTLKELGFRVTPIDQIWYAMTTPKVPDDRVGVLTAAFTHSRTRPCGSRCRRPANTSGR